MPHSQIFPARAQFIGPAGTPLQLLLHIYHGKLDMLTVGAADPEDTDYLDGDSQGWLQPSEVTYVMYGPDGRTVPVGG